MNNKLEHYTSMGKTFVEALCGEDSLEHNGWLSEPNKRAKAAKEQNGWKRVSDVQLTNADMDAAWQEVLDGKWNLYNKINNSLVIQRSATKPYVYRYKGRTLSSDINEAKHMAYRYELALKSMKDDIFFGRRKQRK